MIVIGADTHKASHALAAVDEGTGKVRGSREIKADDPGQSSAPAIGALALDVGAQARRIVRKPRQQLMPVARVPNSRPRMLTSHAAKLRRQGDGSG